MAIQVAKVEQFLLSHPSGTQIDYALGELHARAEGKLIATPELEDIIGEKAMKLLLNLIETDEAYQSVKD